MSEARLGLPNLPSWCLQPEEDTPGLFIACQTVKQRERIMRALRRPQPKTGDRSPDEILHQAIADARHEWEMQASLTEQERDRIADEKFAGSRDACDAYMQQRLVGHLSTILGIALREAPSMAERVASADLRTLTFTIGQLREMLLSRSFSSAPVSLAAARSELDRLLQQEWLRQRKAGGMSEGSSALDAFRGSATRGSREWREFSDDKVPPNELMLRLTWDVLHEKEADPPNENAPLARRLVELLSEPSPEPGSLAFDLQSAAKTDGLTRTGFYRILDELKRLT